MNIKQIYHNYTLWEDYLNGMWRKVSKIEECEYLKRAIEFTGNHELYGHYMIEVVNNWRYSCEHNLTDKSINRRAWIGHAACCLAFNCPEYITRMAWHNLTVEQQDMANAQADSAIKLWENNFIERLECQKDIQIKMF
jgi:hypothetical protein